MQDLKNNIGVVKSLAPDARDADANGTGVDLQGFESATVVIDMGAEGITLSTTNKIETQLETNSEAQVGQFRVVKKHMEVYNGTRGKFYKMYILASVPKNEVGRVKAWQKENDLQKIAKLKSLTDQQSDLIDKTKQVKDYYFKGEL